MSDLFTEDDIANAEDRMSVSHRIVVGQHDPRRAEVRPMSAWDDLFAEARAFEEWYLPTRMGVNAWVGVDTLHGFYGGWSVEGDALYYEWDESVMTTAEGSTPEEVIADLIRIARRYRQRCDEDHAELQAEGLD